MKNLLPKSQQELLKRYQEKSKLTWDWITGKSANADNETISSDIDVDVGTGTHVLLVLLITLTLSFILWACFGHLDIASSAQGEVFPSTLGKSIQHLEGGIVEEILVKEGQSVKTGQPLITLESTSSNADVQQLKVQIASMRIDIQRLKKELAGFPSLKFDAKLNKSHPGLIQEAQKLYQIRKKRYQSQVVSQKEQIEQRHAELNEIKARLKNTSQALLLANEQIKISEELLKEDLTNRYNHIDLLKAANKLQSSIEEDRAGLIRTESALEEEESDLSGIKHQYQEEVTTKLEESRRNLNELTQKMEKFADNLERTVITAPVSGVVKQMFVFTKGGIIKPGATLLDITPSGDQLIIDARLPVKDIGYVKIGQTAAIRLASADGMHFKKLDGKVSFISPDTITPATAESGSGETQAPYYKVRIVTQQDHFVGQGVKYKLYPGIQVSVNILTGSRSVMSYLLSPFTNAFHNSLKER